MLLSDEQHCESAVSVYTHTHTHTHTHIYIYMSIPLSLLSLSPTHPTWFSYGYPVVSAPFVGKTILSPLNCHGVFVENKRAVLKEFISQISILIH